MILLYFVIAIVLIIVAGARWKLHPFLVLIGVSILLAIACGIPLDKLPNVIGSGFSSIFASIGLVIIFGTAIGLILEKSGGAVKLADMVLRAAGRAHPQFAMLLLGWILSIPVFCDSGFIIMNPIRKSMARCSGISPVTLAVCLAGGLLISHVLIPPTPGPIAAAGMTGLEDNMILVIGMGALCSIFPLAACYFWAQYIGPKIRLDENTNLLEGENCERDDCRKLDCESSDCEGNDCRKGISEKNGCEKSVSEKNSCEKSADEIFRESFLVEKLPGAWASILPLIVPILLMGIASVLTISGATTNAAGEVAVEAAAGIEAVIEAVTKILLFLGKPSIALMAGFLCALPLLCRKETGYNSNIKCNITKNGNQSSDKNSKNSKNSSSNTSSNAIATLGEIMDATLKTAGPIIFITAAGGILGQIIVESGFVGYVKENVNMVAGAGIFFPFIIAALLKTSQGSSTVAITTTAGIMGMFSQSNSLMSIMGFTTPLAASLIVMAIGAGSMLFSHANDSYFWVVTNFSGMRVEQGYRTHAIMTVLLALATMLEVWLLYLLIC